MKKIILSILCVTLLVTTFVMAQVGENYKPSIDYENPDVQLVLIDESGRFAMYCINGYLFIASWIGGVTSEIKWYQPEENKDGKIIKMECRCIKEKDL